MRFPRARLDPGEPGRDSGSAVLGAAYDPFALGIDGRHVPDHAMALVALLQGKKKEGDA